MGMCALSWPGADLILGDEAWKRKIAHCVSTASSTTMEEMQERTDGLSWFQLYTGASPEATEELIQRAEAAKYETLVFTVDTPRLSRRIRDLQNGFQVPFKLGPKQILDFADAPSMVLPRIRKALGPDYPIVFDSGIRSGEDIVKALALGADFIMLGRPLMFALGAGGSEGLKQLLDCFKEDLSVAMAQIGLQRSAKASGGFKEIDDVAIAAPLTKYSASITEGARISEFVDKAWKIATNGYPGAVHLSLPVDIMFSSFEEDIGREERPFIRKANKPARAWPDPEALEPILSMIRSAERPILIGGHGVWWSGNEEKLETVGKALAIPVFNIPYHQKLLGEECEAYMGLADFHQYQPSKFAIHNSDCIIMVGARLDNQMNFGNPPFFPKNTNLICINASHEEIEFNRAADHLLLSDTGAFFDALLKIKEEPTWQFDNGWFNLNREKRGEWVKATLDDLEAETSAETWPDNAIHPLQLALDVQEAMNEDDWLVIDGGNTHFWSEIAINLAGWAGKKLGGILHPGTFSMLGVGVSFGISAKNTHPNSNVVVISGDGAFLSGGMSVEAAFQEKHPIVVVIDNNGGLDCISQQQEAPI
ncbi:2-hydroxyacyl-CoA lyase [Nymphon striatum]|nr:2-hydroxyacyl-CoA lyase [Nymphon striatum]